MGADERYRYHVLGFQLESSRAIPGLLPAQTSEVAAAPDVSISFEGLPHWFGGAFIDSCQPTVARRLSFLTVTVYRTADDLYWHLRYTDDTEYLLDERGGQLWVTWREPVTFAEVCPYLLGPVFALLLQLRGRTPLHASVVTIDAHAIAFLGPAGAGKSTTAAKFAQLGYDVLSEDVLHLLATDNHFTALPGSPVLRLLPESANLLRPSEESMVCRSPSQDKICVDLQAGRDFESEPRPLAAIYLLDPRVIDQAAPYIEPLDPPTAVMELMTNTLAQSLATAEARARNFAFVARLAQAVPLRKVVPHRAPERLERMCELIVDDFRNTIARRRRPNVVMHA